MMKSTVDLSRLEIVSTPMCQEILRLAGVTEFRVTKTRDYRNADFVVVLSETEIDESDENSSTQFIKLKLNTFRQIKQSIKKISIALGTEIQNEHLNRQLKWSNENLERLSKIHGKINGNRKIKVKVHSNFLKEIIDDLGFITTKGNNYDFMVYPDYLKEIIKKEIDSAGERAVELPSHNNAPLNPIKRAEMRYEILEKSLCMKH